ncbi:hypothetical protein MPSI1_002846 [Malassezia psittaci]|uniref:Shelterin complex subunit TPP1/Est3 domain-containing protein n=1 Tax=Malassezia psittaci TaxID=1821823 RepID=A0AAF0FB28_9BASI|nr:hypothetical protein MPSI1_002846 [Malassezia psittaci]
MSRSLRPWLHEAVRTASENPDANSSAAEKHSVGSRVQILRFLTFRPENDPRTPMDIWAQVRDRTHWMPARFASASVDDFQINSGGMRFTQLRGAILAINKCRVTLDHVQTDCTRKNSNHDLFGAVTLHVDQFTVLDVLGDTPDDDGLKYAADG